MTEQATYQDTASAAEQYFNMQSKLNELRQSATQALLRKRDNLQTELEQIVQQLRDIGYAERVMKPISHQAHAVNASNYKPATRKRRFSEETRAKMRISQQRRWANTRQIHG